MSPGQHRGIALLAMVAGFFAPPAISAVLFRSFASPGGWASDCAAVIFLGGAFGGAFLAQAIMKRVPARCPDCGGQAWWNGGSGKREDPSRYTCERCGRVRD
jgi:hypothetical protein